MRKLFLSLLFLIGITSNSWSQWAVGLEAGLGKNYLNTSNDYRAFVREVPVSSFSIAIPVKYKINDWLSVQSAAQLITKGNERVRSDFYEGVYYKNNNTYLQVPLLANLSFGSKSLRGFLNIGGYASYWSSGKLSGLLPDFFSINNVNVQLQEPNLEDLKYNENYVFNKERDRRIDLGLMPGVGISYQLKSNLEFLIEGRYYRSMLDMQKKYMINQVARYNDTFMIQVGMFYHLSSKSKNIKTP